MDRSAQIALAEILATQNLGCRITLQNIPKQEVPEGYSLVEGYDSLFQKTFFTGSTVEIDALPF